MELAPVASAEREPPGERLPLRFHRRLEPGLGGSQGVRIRLALPPQLRPAVTCDTKEGWNPSRFLTVSHGD